jgi:hypothetical protein
VLTENGVIGLVLYCAVWLFAAFRMRAVLRAETLAGRLSPGQAALLQIATFVPCLLYVSFEASGTHSLVVLTFISLLPEGIAAWSVQVRERVSERPARALVRQPLRPQLLRPELLRPPLRRAGVGRPS